MIPVRPPCLYTHDNYTIIIMMDVDRGAVVRGGTI